MKTIYHWQPSSRSHLEDKVTITRRKENYARLGITLLSLVIKVGSDINSISQYFNFVDATYYVLNSNVHAVDCCFKIIHALNLQYFIVFTRITQKGFYKMKTLWDVGICFTVTRRVIIYVMQYKKKQ